MGCRGHCIYQIVARRPSARHQQGGNMPYNLKRWRIDAQTDSVHFFTCGRPGREKGKSEQVPDKLVHRWVLGLQECCGPDLVIVSLLGRKLDGRSEFSFYFFCGGFDTTAERKGRLSFQEWLDNHHKALNISVYEFPTTDRMGVPLEIRKSVAVKIKDLILSGRTVVVVDSAGAERTGRIRDHIGAKEDSSSRA